MCKDYLKQEKEVWKNLNNKAILGKNYVKNSIINKINDKKYKKNYFFVFKLKFI